MDPLSIAGAWLLSPSWTFLDNKEVKNADFVEKYVPILFHFLACRENFFPRRMHVFLFQRLGDTIYRMYDLTNWFKRLFEH